MSDEYEKITASCKPKYYDMDTKPIDDVLKWAGYIECLRKSGDFILKQEIVGKYEISTIYIGLNMGIFNPEPLIFETMIFCEDNEDPLYCWMERYTYKEQALNGHENAVLLASGVK